MWFTPHLSESFPAALTTSPVARASTPVEATPVSSRRIRASSASMLYWPGGSVYEALSEVAIVLHFRLDVAHGQVEKLLNTPCDLSPGMITPVDLAQAAGDSLPSLWVTLHMGGRTIVVSRSSPSPSDATVAVAGMASDVASSRLSLLSAGHAVSDASRGIPAGDDGFGVRVSPHPAVIPGAATIQSPREMLRTLLVPVTLRHGGIRSVLRQIAHATGWSCRLHPNASMATLGDGLPWGRPAPVLGVLRQMGRQPYLDVQVHPASRLIIVQITE